MKITMPFALVGCLLCSCGDDKLAGPPRRSPTGRQPGAQAAEASTATNAQQVLFVPGDAVPPMEALREGKFNQKGLADAFQQAVGWPMPEYVKAHEGKYKVWNEKDYGGKNRAFCRACYTVAPNKAVDLADAIEKAWRAKYGVNPDIKIARSIYAKDYTEGSRTIHSGSIGIGVHDSYAIYTLLDYTMIIDPVSGEIALTSYRGTNDKPSEREKPDE